MIVAELDHVTRQAAESQAIHQALHFLQQARGQALPDGQIEIEGDRVYALIQSYQSRSERDHPTFEAHRKYVDVQYIVSGTEVMGWAPLDLVTTTVPYDEDKDALLGTVPPDKVTFIRFAAGQVILLFPTDAHAPGLAAGTPALVKKIVIKVALASD